MKTIDELVDELAVRLNSGQTVKQKKSQNLFLLLNRK